MFPQFLTLTMPSRGVQNLRAVFARINLNAPATPHLPVSDAAGHQFLLPVFSGVQEEIK
jgi:hypothetical protein